MAYLYLQLSLSLPNSPAPAAGHRGENQPRYPRANGGLFFSLNSLTRAFLEHDAG